MKKSNCKDEENSCFLRNFSQNGCFLCNATSSLQTNKQTKKNKTKTKIQKNKRKGKATPRRNCFFRTGIGHCACKTSGRQRPLKIWVVFYWELEVHSRDQSISSSLICWTLKATDKFTGPYNSTCHPKQSMPGS